MQFKKIIHILLAPILGVLAWFFLQNMGAPILACKMGIVVVWIATWWITEAVEMGISALLPIVLMPFLGIADTQEVAVQYSDQIIFLFIGGFIIAYAIEKWNLHERLSLAIILGIGNTPARLLLGVMLTAYFISMWISNTATVMMLFSAVVALCKHPELNKKEVANFKNIHTALLLGLSYGATIGGMATLVGTPPNLIFAGFWEKNFPELPALDFWGWFKIAFPYSVAVLLAAYSILRFLFIQKNDNKPFDFSTLRRHQQQLGKMSYEERCVLVVFVATALLWFFRSNIEIGGFKISGWSSFFAKGAYIKDGAVAIVMSMLLFFIPQKKDKNAMLMEWKDISQLPLSVLLLFGSGFALAKGFEVSGLSVFIAQKLVFLQNFPTVLIIAGLCVLITVLSELASNTATIQVMLPIIAPLCVAMHLPPYLTLLTATLSASIGYMLPVATAANTIVYSTGHISSKNMIKAGLLLDIVAVVLLVVWSWWWGI